MNAKYVAALLAGLCLLSLATASESNHKVGRLLKLIAGLLVCLLMAWMCPLRCTF
jgi:hypothetical protein